ncbi:MAG: hypothetical protein WBX25_28315 [Rhodomicrobium sp.]
MRSYLPIALSIAILAGTGTAFANDSNAKSQPGVPPTGLQDGPNSGTQNMGSTGWTGGEGSTRMGVTDEGPRGSGQPAVVKGLDPKKATNSRAGKTKD